MAILTRDAILSEIDQGRLVIDPFKPEQIGAASVDLHLGQKLRRLCPLGDRPIPVRGDVEVDVAAEQIEIDDCWVLHPGQTVHGITRERISLPPDLCGWLEGRSRIARLGLSVHVTSGFVQPGCCNHQVLELTNVSAVPLALYPDARICQIVLQRTEGEAVYRGRFADQDAP